MKMQFHKKIFYFCFLQLVFFLPSFGQEKSAVGFKLGVENIPASLFKKVCPHKKKDSCAIGLITNQTGVDQQGKRTVDILVQRGYKPHYIFAPEHGLNGVLAERDVHDSVDKKTGIPVISLYGNGSGKMIAPEYIKNVDSFVFDIQDSGMRHYTYISTLLNTMKIAAENDKPYIVLDRPNPLGSMMEGPLVVPELISFISIAPIPLRHGMTIGELAWYFNRYVLEKPAALHVVKMKNYNRTQGFVGDIMYQLSPNLQSLQSCYGYSFLGLLGEIEPFDVGVGTPMAFRCIALPDALQVSPDVWKRLQVVLDSFGVKSFFYHHINKKNKKMSKGLRLEFAAISDLHAFELFIAILQFFKKEQIPFSFSASFNKAVGTQKVQEVIAGTLPIKLFFNEIMQDLRTFHKRAQCSFFYQPLPNSL
ncbi:MAG TPA: DUF1343 domain-containing protein [Candidatus Babeliales bacterium]|nr:DUF1343 domain-containing protein [Candidatus Babeliales bacterium]